MRYIVDWAENKSADWKVISVHEVVEGGQSFTNVSINRTSKSGETFPNFDQIAPGTEIEADHWRSPAGKDYLFPPKVKKSNGGGRSYVMEKAMERKETSISNFQERKEENIARAGAFRDATLILVELIRKEAVPPDREEIRAVWRDWVRFFMNEAEQPFI